MTDRLAFVLAALTCAALALDLVANDGAAVLFLSVKFNDLVEWMAFWR